MKRLDPDRSHERGAILILTLILMAATVFLGLSYLSASTFYLETQDTELQRLKARALAEGAVEIAQQELLDTGVPSNVTDANLGDGTYSFNIASAGGDIYDIVSVSTIDAVRVKCYSRVQFSASTLELMDTLVYGGAVSGNMGSGTDFVWGGTASITAPAISFDRGAYEYDILETGSATFDNLSLAGNILCQQDLVLSQTCSLKGSIYTYGDLTIEGNGIGSMSLLAGDSNAILLVEGNLEIRHLTSLTIQGSVFVLGDANIWNISRFDVQGSLVVNGNLRFQLGTSSGAWTYDPAIAAKPPEVIQGGNATRTLTETWRKFSGN